MVELTRRQFMTLSGAAGLSMAAGGAWATNLYTGSFFDTLKVTEYHLVTKRWPAHYPSLTIAFLTDLHVGCQSVGLDKLADIVTQTNKLGADIILLGGDYLTMLDGPRYSKYIEPELFVPALKQLKAPLGVFSVLGNHDWKTNGEGMWKALEKSGIRVLENDAAYIRMEKSAGFWLVGLADLLTREVDYAGAIKKANNDKPKILLSHNPATYNQVTSDALVQLSGHTHGGQVRLPMIGPIRGPAPPMPMEWLYGRVDEKGVPMIVSSGVGTSALPIKNTPCEVVRMTINSVGDANGLLA